MASKVVEVSGQAIENFSAEKVVFAEKKSPDLVPASEKVDTIARLFYADTGHGEVFKHIYIQKELKKIISEDHELLYLLTRIHSDLLDEEIDELIARSNETPHITHANQVKKKWDKLKDLKGYFFRSNFENPNLEDFVYSFFEPYIYWFAVKGNDLAFDISFGNKSGHSLILSRAFHEVATVHFNKFYQNSERVFKAEVYEAYRTLTFQADIFSQSAQNIFKSEEFFTKLFVEQKDRRYIDLIVIGPISDESKVITANLLIEKLYAPHKCFRKGSILMAIRPLMIGTESRTNHFIQYQPSKGIFKELKDDVNATLANNCTVYSVKPNGELEKFKSPEAVAVSLSESDEDASPDKKPGGMARLYGIPVYSNNVFCIYEFRVFKYIGRHGNE
uniref:Uncharacterized protein n=1 Tax=Amphimedon queenslandica TaxID=400682 RepID=A0A1X7UFD5_AMPQE